MNFQLPTSPLSVTSLLKLNLVFLKTNVKHYILFVLLSLLFGMLPHFFPSFNWHHPSEIEKTLEAYWSYAVLYSIFAIYLLGAVLIRIHDLQHQKFRSYPTILIAVLKKLPVAVIAIVFVSLSVLLGYVLFVVPGIILTVYFFFFIPILFTEKPFLDSLKESFKLVDQNWLYTFITLLTILGSFMFILYFAESYTLGLWVVQFNNGQILLGYNLLRLLLNGFYYPFFISFTFLMLNDFRLRAASSVPN